MFEKIEIPSHAFRDMNCVQKLNNNPSDGSLLFFGARLLFFTILSFLGTLGVKKKDSVLSKSVGDNSETHSGRLNCPISQTTRI